MQNRRGRRQRLAAQPEERWRYIKELESRQPGASARRLNRPPVAVMKPEQRSTSSASCSPRCRPICASSRPSRVPWTSANERRRAPADASASRLAQQQQAQQQQWAQTQAQTNSSRRALQQPKPVQQQQPKQTASNQQPYRICCRRQRIPMPTQPRTQAAAPVTRWKKRRNHRREERRRSWMIQCGSLKAPSRPKPSALSWLSKGLLRTLPLTTAETA